MNRCNGTYPKYSRGQETQGQGVISIRSNDASLNRTQMRYFIFNYVYEPAAFGYVARPIIGVQYFLSLPDALGFANESHILGKTDYPHLLVLSELMEPYSHQFRLKPPTERVAIVLTVDDLEKFRA